MLLPQFGQEAGVGDELVAGQAGVPAVAALPGRQGAVAVGQDPVGTLVQLQHVVEVFGVQRGLAAVAGEFAVAQELGFGGLSQRLGVGHRHRRGQVPQPALHHVQRDPRVQQAGRRGVPEGMGPLQVDDPAVAITDPRTRRQLGEQLTELAGRVRPVTVAVHHRAEEQVAGRTAGPPAGGEMPGGPVPLRLDDRDDLGIDEDGVGCAADLGLLVAQPGRERGRVLVT